MRIWWLGDGSRGRVLHGVSRGGGEAECNASGGRGLLVIHDLRKPPFERGEALVAELGSVEDQCREGGGGRGVRNLFLFSVLSVLSVFKLSFLSLVFLSQREVVLLAGRRNFVGPAGVPGRRGGCGIGPVQRALGPQSEPSRSLRVWCAPCGAARDAKQALAQPTRKAHHHGRLFARSGR